MKRTNEPDLPTKAPPSPNVVEDDDDDDLDGPETTPQVMIVPLDYSHKFIHLSYHWIESADTSEPNVESALLDVTDMDPKDRRHLLGALESNETLTKSVIFMVAQFDDGMEMEIHERVRKLLEKSKWCPVPKGNKDDSKIVQIVSFLRVEGVY